MYLKYEFKACANEHFSLHNHFKSNTSLNQCNVMTQSLDLKKTVLLDFYGRIFHIISSKVNIFLNIYIYMSIITLLSNTVAQWLTSVVSQQGYHMFGTKFLPQSSNIDFRLISLLLLIEKKITLQNFSSVINNKKEPGLNRS